MTDPRFYPWLKGLHIFFVMSWMAAVFYLPRMLVHYTEGRNAGQGLERLVIMERNLFTFSNVVALPALGIGFWLWRGYHIPGGWVHIKLTLVILLFGYHHNTHRLFKRLLAGTSARSAFFYRMYNEGVLLLVLPIVLLATLKRPG